MTTTEMLAACFEHQHPELYGREPVYDTVVTAQSHEPVPLASTTVIPEEPMGHPEAIPW